MPKNMQGRVGRDAMQYMVGRYFGHEHGWSIKGFDPASTGGNSSVEASSVQILEQKLPLYVEAVMEQRLEQQGFALNDVVTIVAALDRSELTDVVLTYMLTYAFQADRRNRTDLPITWGRSCEGTRRAGPAGSTAWRS